MTLRSRRKTLARLTALGGASLLGCGALSALKAQAQVQVAQGRVIEVDVRRFKFTPEEITIKAGEQVTLAFKSLDFFHGFSAPDLGLRADLIPGQVTKVKILITKAGRVDFLCDNFCGDGHEQMHGVLIVEASAAPQQS